MKALPQLSFMQALRLGWGRLFEFNGRSRRSEYWWWMLAVGIVHIINAIIAALTAFILTSATGISVISGAFTLWYSLLAYTLNTGVMACSLGITVRRLHDCGRTTVWLYLSFILGVIINFGYAGLSNMVSEWSHSYVSESDTITAGILGVILFILSIPYLVFSILVIVFCSKDGLPYPNEYGPSPKYIA